MRRLLSNLILPACFLAMQDATLKEDVLGRVVIDIEQMTDMRDITPEERRTSPYAETMIGTSGRQYYVYERFDDIKRTIYETCYPVHTVDELKQEESPK